MKTTILEWLALGLLINPLAANAAVLYTSQTSLLAALGPYVTDDYTAPGYAAGDISDQPTYDRHSDAHMSGVVGETDYQSTGYASASLVGGVLSGNSSAYCAGCNGSFRLTFTSTSMGNAIGVYGAGLRFANLIASDLYHAFVTYGDGSTEDVALPFASTSMSYWGITSDLLVRSIDFGRPNGASTQSGSFVIDDLTIGAVPEPGTLALVSLGICALTLVRRRKAS